MTQVVINFLSCLVGSSLGIQYVLSSIQKLVVVDPVLLYLFFSHYFSSVPFSLRSFWPTLHWWEPRCSNAHLQLLRVLWQYVFILFINIYTYTLNKLGLNIEPWCTILIYHYHHLALQLIKLTDLLWSFKKIFLLQYILVT